MIKKYINKIFNILGFMLMTFLFLIIIISDFSSVAEGISLSAEGKINGVLVSSYSGDRNFDTFQRRVFESCKFNTIKDNDGDRYISTASDNYMNLSYSSWINPNTKSKEIKKNIIFFNRNP